MQIGYLKKQDFWDDSISLDETFKKLLDKNVIAAEVCGIIVMGLYG